MSEEKRLINFMDWTISQLTPKNLNGVDLQLQRGKGTDS